MSKSRGNTVEPWQVLDTYGADAFRWYFFTSKQPWDGYRFSAETIGEGVRLFLKQLWSTYYFYVLYAHAAADELSAGPGGRRRRRPRWRPGRRPRPLGAVAHGGHGRAGGRAPGRVRRDDGGRAIASLVDELSNWYVRRSRRRFWDGDPSAFADAAHVPADGVQAAGSVLPVRGG